MSNEVSLEQRLTILERRIRFLQAMCVTLLLLIVLAAVYIQHGLRASLFTDSIVVPSHFWTAPAFLNIGVGEKATALTLSRLSSNEEVRIESGTQGTAITFRDSRSKKRLSFGLSSSGDPFLQSFDRAGKPIPLAVLSPSSNQP